MAGGRGGLAGRRGDEAGAGRRCRPRLATAGRGSALRAAAAGGGRRGGPARPGNAAGRGSGCLPRPAAAGRRRAGARPRGGRRRRGEGGGRGGGRAGRGGGRGCEWIGLSLPFFYFFKTTEPFPTAVKRQSAKALPTAYSRQIVCRLPPHGSRQRFFFFGFLVPIFSCGLNILFQVQCTNLGPFDDILLYFIQLFYFLAFSRIVQI